MSDNRFWAHKGVLRLIGAEVKGEDEEGNIIKEGGKEITFYPLPVGPLLKVKNTLKEAAPFMATCFGNSDGDQDVDSMETVKEVGEGVYPVTQRTVKAISPSTASHRFKQRKESIESLVDALTSDATKNLIADIIIASASDEFKEEDRSMLTDEVPATVLFELVTGVIEANKGAFAGLGEFLPRLLQNETVAAGVDAVKSVMTEEKPKAKTES